MKRSKLFVALRKAHKTQKELSIDSGVSLSAIHAYSNGYKDINKARIGAVVDLAFNLNCKMVDILTDEILIEKLKIVSK